MIELDAIAPTKTEVSQTAIAMGEILHSLSSSCQIRHLGRLTDLAEKQMGHGFW
ncbi:hypothetical protein [Coleofasciculus sp.]|uniref:hypothetical protein n=1 Tax=Coleofasciculus sp. TaxID=3100458 RepID=UPI0039F7FB56